MRNWEFKRCLFLLLILALGAFLRFYQMDGYGLWSDEFLTLHLAAQPSYSAVVKTSLAVPQPVPPLYFLLEKVSVDRLGASEISLRLLSALSSTLTIGLLFWLGKELFSAEAGAFAALLFSIHPIQIVYGQNGRPYAFCLMLSAASVLAFLKWIKEGKWPSQVLFVVSTTLLFYSHYIFAPLIFVLNAYFFGMLLLGDKKFLTLWKRWLGLQVVAGLLCLPLAGQMAHLIGSRHSLNWSRHIPELADFFSFVDFPCLFFSVLLTAVLGVILLGFRRLLRRGEMPQRAASSPAIAAAIDSGAPHPFLLAGLWLLLPSLLFAVLYLMTGIDLFVKRYLLLTALPTYLLIPALALNFPFKTRKLKSYFASPSAQCSRQPSVSIRSQEAGFELAPSGLGRQRGPTYLMIGRLFLVIVVVCSAYTGPWSIYERCGHFSYGVPGGDVWRETLLELKNPAFDAPLFLFQSPYVESNALNYQNDPALSCYLSAPMHSFYVKDNNRKFVLLPWLWFIENETHQKFKAELRQMILKQPRFVLFCDQTFWGTFSAWLSAEFSGDYEIVPELGFHSTNYILLIEQLRLVPHKQMHAQD
jgi:hypothetical protein